MKKMIQVMILGLLPIATFAETNATIEVHFFKTWVVKGEVFEQNFSLAIKNTGTDSIPLFKSPLLFGTRQLNMRPLPRNHDATEERKRQDREHRTAISGNADDFFALLPEETHVYEGWKFYIMEPLTPFSEKMQFTVSVYLGKDFWLDSEPMTLNGVVPDSEEPVATITDRANPGQHKLVAITYKNERWLYSKTTNGAYFEICPVSLTNKIRIEPYDGKDLYKIWDGEKSMIYRDGQSILTEGPDEHNVLGKWTRERKQKAEADNAEVRRKKAEAKE